MPLNPWQARNHPHRITNYIINSVKKVLIQLAVKAVN